MEKETKSSTTGTGQMSGHGEIYPMQVQVQRCVTPDGTHTWKYDLHSSYRFVCGICKLNG